MTREKAIIVFKAFMDNPLFSDVHKTAFNIAIHDIKQRHDWDINNLVLINKDNYEPLEQESCEDCISRQTVFDMLEDINAETDGVGFYYDRWVEYIKNLPPVTPQAKMGEWILHPSNKEQNERDFIWWECSECGQVIFSETEKDRREFHAFCGRCGAKMEVE